MARWRLVGPHYLHVVVDGEWSQWEYQEQNRNTGRMNRKRYPVPLFLDPKDPADHNYKELGLIVVCRGQPARGNERDFEFKGEPTPDMEPLDAEAEAITGKLKSSWAHPIDSLSGTYSDEVYKSFDGMLRDAMAKAMNTAAQAPTQAQAIGVDVANQIAEMQKRMVLLEEQNAKLQAGAIEPLLEVEPIEELPVDPLPAVDVAPLKRQPPITRPPQVASRR